MLKRRNVIVETIAVIAIPAHPEVMGTVVPGIHARNLTVVNRKLTLTTVQLKLPKLSIQHFQF